jgi:hypothetical protein
MRVSWTFFLMSLLAGCQMFRSIPDYLNIPLQIKASIQGEIKGYKVSCEKTISLGQGQWGVMCSIGNGMEVKYRVNPLRDGRAKIEFQVDKEKPGESKIIAFPTLVVKKQESAQSITTTDSSNLIVTAERIE